MRKKKSKELPWCRFTCLIQTLAASLKVLGGVLQQSRALIGITHLVNQLIVLKVYS